MQAPAPAGDGFPAGQELTANGPAAAVIRALCDARGYRDGRSEATRHRAARRAIGAERHLPAGTQAQGPTLHRKCARSSTSTTRACERRRGHPEQCGAAACHRPTRRRAAIRTEVRLPVRLLQPGPTVAPSFRNPETTAFPHLPATSGFPPSRSPGRTPYSAAGDFDGLLGKGSTMSFRTLL